MASKHPVDWLSGPGQLLMKALMGFITIWGIGWGFIGWIDERIIKSNESIRTNLQKHIEAQAEEMRELKSDLQEMKRSTIDTAKDTAYIKGVLQEQQQNQRRGK